MEEKLVWYVCYGSNLAIERFMCYLTGGDCERYHLKANPNRKFYNQTPPRQSKIITLPFKLFFAGNSGNWNQQGASFLDYETKGNTIGRAYLITEEQYLHVWKGEGKSSRWYGHEINLEPIDGIPAKTFTCDLDFRQEDNEPSQEYLNCMCDGLVECGLTKEKALEYIESIRNNKYL